MNRRVKILPEEAATTITNETTPKSRWHQWGERIVVAADAWLPASLVSRGWRSIHFWIIAGLLVILTLVYYGDRIFVGTVLPPGQNFFTTVHDLHRALLLIPVLYAAVAFRFRGGLVALLALLAIMLPRALLISTYPDPLLRASTFWLLATVVTLLVALILNIRESEKEARQELADYAQRLAESQEQLLHVERLTSMGQLAAAVAHEVNNPIAGVLAYAQLMTKKMNAGTLPKETALDYLARMESELVRIGGIIRNLLDFARQREPTFTLVDLNEVIERAYSLVGHAAQMQRVEVIRELSPTLPVVMADRDQLQQVMVNLILNAIQAMPDGGTLTLRTASESGSHVKVEVQDTGCGISPENMKKLFTPFFTTKKEVKGVGLGLAVSHGIIQRHQGRIEVESEIGKGTTFTIYLEAHGEREG